MTSTLTYVMGKLKMFKNLLSLLRAAAFTPGITGAGRLFAVDGAFPSDNQNFDKIYYLCQSSQEPPAANLNDQEALREQLVETLNDAGYSGNVAPAAVASICELNVSMIV
jgi:hypothetical protein